MILLTDGNEPLGIGRGQIRRAPRGLIGQRKIQLSRRRQSQFGPQLGYSRELLDQAAVTRKGVIMPTVEQVSLGILPEIFSLRRPLQFRQVIHRFAFGSFHNGYSGNLA